VRGRLVAGRYDDSEVGRWARDEVSRNDPLTLLQAGQALGAFSSHEWIDTVDVPAAVVVTTRDRLVPPSRQRRLAAAIPGASVHDVDGDHVVCAVEPEAFVPALLDACADVTNRAGLRRR
jgi:pimeloyl-ACP methyl ester carboxylesterase